MFRYFIQMSLKKKLLLFLMLLIILPVTLNGIITYDAMASFTMEREVEHAQRLSQQIINTFDLYFRSVDKLSYQVAYSDSASIWLKSDYEREGELGEYRYRMDQMSAYRFLNGMSNTVYGVDSISLYADDGHVFYGFSVGQLNFDYRLESEEWYGKLKASNGEKLLVGPYLSRLTDLNDRHVISLVRKVLDLQSFLPVGTIVIEVDMDEMFATHLGYVRQSMDSSLFIMNEDSGVIYSSADSRMQGETIDPNVLERIGNTHAGSFRIRQNNEDALVTFYKSGFTGWTVVNIISSSELLHGIQTVRNNAVFITGMLVIGAVLLSLLFSNYIVQPLHKLVHMTQMIEQGEFGQTIEVINRDEVGNLTLSFNRMSMRLRELVHQIVKKEEEKRTLEISALQTQISPHFIYNTLGVIKQIAVIQKAPGIHQLVDSLIQLLQATARHDGGLISFRDELELLRHYIFIQETRYCGKFDVDFDVSEEVLNCLTLNLLLQPIVENAIFHGAAMKEGLSTITIRIHMPNNDVICEVEDTGAGMEQEQTDALLLPGRGTRHLGISNVDRRIKLHFGKDYGLRIQSKPGVGTKVVIRLPRLSREENDAC